MKINYGRLTHKHEASTLVISIGLVLGVAGFATTRSAASAPAGYSLAWSDEFSGSPGSAPNSANWSYDTGAGGWGNGEWETYVTDTTHAGIVSDSAATDGRALDIQVTYNAAANSYQSARIKTQGKQQFTYGYIECRARTQTGLGEWPAFWMLGSSFNGSNWPQCGEMDIMEYIGNSTEQASFHMGTWEDRIDWSASYNVNNPDGYHTYGLLWTSSGVTNYVDGNEFEYHASSSPGWIFDQPFFFLLNFAVGANAGNPWSNGTPVFPWNYYIDYVRVYEPGSGGGTGGGGGGGGTGGSGGNISNGVHTLTPACATGSRLDDNAAGTANGTLVQIWQSNGTQAQNWNFANIGGTTYNMAVNLGPYCLDDDNGAVGTQDVIWGCDGNNNQKWTATAVAGGYKFVNGGNNLCLDVYSAGTANGTKVDSYTCNGTNAQTWAVN